MHTRHVLMMLTAVLMAFAACGDDKGKQEAAEGDPLLLAAEALGGQEALEAFESLEVVSSGEVYLFGEGFEPVLGDHLRGRFTSTLAWEVETQRLRQDVARDIDNFGFPTELIYREVVADGRGVVDGCDSVFNLCSGRLRDHRLRAIDKHQRLINPHALVKRALQTPEAVISLDDEDLEGVPHAALEVEDGGSVFVLLIEPKTGEIARVRTSELEPILGDVVVETRFADWQAVSDGGLRFPQRVETRSNGLLLYVEEGRDVTVNPELAADHFAKAQALAEEVVDEELEAWGDAHAHWIHRSASAGIPFDGVQTDLDVLEVVEGSGVYFFTGSHGTMAVEQEGGIVVIEAPLHERRMEAVLEAIDGLWPGKPITHVIATHHHYDHSGGVRALVARGAQLVISERGQPFFADLLAASHSRWPDALHDKPTEASMILVPDDTPVVLGDPQRPIEVRHIATPHASDMVVAYVPHIKAVFQTDLYIPGEFLLNLPPPEPSASTAKLMVDELEGFGLDIEIIAGGHGTFVDWERAREHIVSQP